MKKCAQKSPMLHRMERPLVKFLLFLFIISLLYFYMLPKTTVLNSNPHNTPRTNNSVTHNADKLEIKNQSEAGHTRSVENVTNILTKAEHPQTVVNEKNTRTEAANTHTTDTDKNIFNEAAPPHIVEIIRKFGLDQPDAIKYIKNPPLKELYAGGFDISIEYICPDSGASLKVITLIKSARSNVDRRMAIRQTYGHYALRKDVSIAFLIGRSKIREPEIDKNILWEADLYGDVVLGHYIDTFYNLTLKTTSALEWVSTYCSKAKFLLMADDDVFLNFPRILNLVESWNNQTRTIIGPCFPAGVPERSSSDRHYISVQEYSPPSYPPYMFGEAGYFITCDLVTDLYKQGLTTPYVPSSEDVFYTGFVAQIINVTRVFPGVIGFDKPNVGWYNDNYWSKPENQRKCSFQQSVSVYAKEWGQKFHLWNATLVDGPCA